MATKTICDNCGGDGAHRVSISYATSGPKEIYEFSDLPEFDHDLCARCFLALKRTLVPILLPNSKK
jgi:hypothetical protein